MTKKSAYSLSKNHIFYFYFLVREQLKELTKQFDKSENDLKALQSVGQIVGEVLKQLTEDKCNSKSNQFFFLIHSAFDIFFFLNQFY